MVAALTNRACAIIKDTLIMVSIFCTRVPIACVVEDMCRTEDLPSAYDLTVEILLL